MTRTVADSGPAGKIPSTRRVNRTSESGSSSGTSIGPLSASATPNGPSTLITAFPFNRTLPSLTTR
ncbi:hypothetical protein GCM10009558_056000 [Virgisporangium aurantiacum]